MSPKGRKNAIIISGIFVLMMFAGRFVPAGSMAGAETAASWLGLVFWGLAAVLFTYSIWEILRDWLGKDD
ncbi:MAG: hypothetical protein ACI86S_001967 [Paracoccaceae bacterium]